MRPTARRLAPTLIASALFAAGLSLAGCYEREDAAPQPAPAPETAAVLAGVDLGKPVRVLGTEPFWGIDITHDIIRALLPYRGIHMEVEPRILDGDVDIERL